MNYLNLLWQHIIAIPLSVLFTLTLILGIPFVGILVVFSWTKRRVSS
jgi:hypothetical protein